MEKIKLGAKTRLERGAKVNKGRQSGLIPAIVYGKAVAAKSLWIDNLDFKRLIKKAGESSLIDLDIDEKEQRKVIIYEMQKDPVTGRCDHVDFFQVKMDEKIETEVELAYIGESPAVKEAGGVLVKNLDKVKVKCLPGDLPSQIEIDISSIKNFDDHIFAKDLQMAKGVEIDLDPEMVVALVAPPRSDQQIKELEEKVEADVTKVEGVVKEEPVEGVEGTEGAEGEKAGEANREGKKAGEKNKK